MFCRQIVKRQHSTVVLGQIQKNYTGITYSINIFNILEPAVFPGELCWKKVKQVWETFVFISLQMAPEKEIERLRSQLKEREEQVHQAAQAGLDLLNQQMELQNRLEEQRVEMTNALEVGKFLWFHVLCNACRPVQSELCGLLWPLSALSQIVCLWRVSQRPSSKISTLCKRKWS